MGKRQAEKELSKDDIASSEEEEEVSRQKKSHSKNT